MASRPKSPGEPLLGKAVNFEPWIREQLQLNLPDRRLLEDLLLDVWVGILTRGNQDGHLADAAVREVIVVVREVVLEVLCKFQATIYPIQNWPDDHRRAFTLTKVYGLTRSDIAKRLNLAPEIVEVHLRQAAIDYAKCMFAASVAPKVTGS